MYLLDTNIWLELLLDQDKAYEVEEFLSKNNSEDIFITDFTIFSIGIILTKLKKKELLESFIRKVVIESNINRLALSEDDLIDMINDDECSTLDFDDSYQYFAAKKRNIIILSFDSDFDKTKLGRKTPANIKK